MTTLYANPYDLTATGFYFDSAEEYRSKSDAVRNDFGDPVEEFEIQVIDGEGIDLALAKAWDLNQTNTLPFMEACRTWDDDEKIRFIIAVGECGYAFDPDDVSPLDYDVDVCDCYSMKGLAELFVEEGLFGTIPDFIQNYINYDAIARDLAVDYSETVIDGKRLIYRCG